MDLSRRRLLKLTAVSSTAGFAGCSTSESTDSEPDDRNGETESETTPEESFPKPEVLQLLRSESRLVSIDNPDDHTFTATVQNTGHSGDIAVGLFWQKEEHGKKPESIDSLDTGVYDVERTKELYFNADERRTVEFSASPPNDSVGYYFLAQPATYGADIHNAGAGGRITVNMNFKGSTLGTDASERTTVYIGDSETREVLFDVTIMPETEWEIQANADSERTDLVG